MTDSSRYISFIYYDNIPVKGAISVDNKKNRGKRLTVEEISQLADLARMGLTHAEIARKLNRDADTISKYRRRLEVDAEISSVRREALKDAQVAHWRALREALDGLRGGFKPPSVRASERPDQSLVEERIPVPLDNRRRFLIHEGLREHHAPEHELWPLWDEWDKQVALFHQKCRWAWDEINRQLADHSGGEDRGVGYEVRQELFQHEILRDFFHHVAGVNIQELALKELPPGTFKLVRGVVLAAGPDEGVIRQQVEFFNSTVRSLVDANEGVQAQTIYAHLVALQGPLNDALDRLSLMEGFPGECPFCPLKAPGRRTRGRRRKTRA